VGLVTDLTKSDGAPYADFAELITANAAFFLKAQGGSALGFTPENIANRGVADGYAPLNSIGLVPASYLPGFTDEVVEVADFASLPAVGESGIIYITVDNSNTYRWGGTVYVELGTAEYWEEVSGNVYRPTGSVYVGKSTGTVKLDVAGSIAADNVLIGRTGLTVGTDILPSFRSAEILRTQDGVLSLPLQLRNGIATVNSEVGLALRITTLNDVSIGVDYKAVRTNSIAPGACDAVIAVATGAGLVDRLWVKATGDVGVGTPNPDAKLAVIGRISATESIRVGNDAAAASAANVGAIRYRVSGNNSYCEMVMQTGAASYTWTIIQQNTW
jgi:hypothetical protein